MFKLFRPDLDEPTLADAVLCLGGDEPRYVTGIVLPVDMGVLNRV